MWVAFVPSGITWLDQELGGFPSRGIVATTGTPGSGKTSLAISFTIAALRRGEGVCFLTSENADAVLEMSAGLFEEDLKPSIGQNQLSLLSFAPFFVNKMKSLNAASQPLAELRTYLSERRIRNLVVDTLDPMLSYIDASNAKASVRAVMADLQSMDAAVLCTLGGDSAAAAEFGRAAGGSLELSPESLVVRQAGWCNVYDLHASIRFVQGRGIVAQRGTGPVPPARARLPSVMSERPAGPSRAATPSPPSHHQEAGWQSLIADVKKIKQGGRVEVSIVNAPAMPVQKPRTQSAVAVTQPLHAPLRAYNRPHDDDRAPDSRTLITNAGGIEEEPVPESRTGYYVKPEDR